ncbi:hypothetical protein G4B88_009601 [Cannabis sativa]|uniref:Uncharacterized protein n=1 Tax=Cannabis sativa TaxID=3483 RepID=A0A7J6DLH1_CANSA|nr:hypothetical protein G4B88_009601 [Cannabis sativa]
MVSQLNSSNLQEKLATAEATLEEQKTSLLFRMQSISVTRVNLRTFSNEALEKALEKDAKEYDSTVEALKDII